MQDDPQNLTPPVAETLPSVAKALVPAAEALAPATPVPANPAWAKDLRELYNAVVEEPLPDSFIALLSQLDAED